MIKGLTHDTNGEVIPTTKYRGKISVGYSPGEGPNKSKYPVAAGFFRVLKEVNKTERKKNGSLLTKKMWVDNVAAQERLEKAQPVPSKTPKKLEIVCLYKTPQEIWESSLSMYSASEGLMCRSNGEGTTAKYLTFDPDGNRSWVDREFDFGEEGIYVGCPYKKCPDFIQGKCKPIGLMKCFPSCDLAINPYRFETRSINSIIGIESTFNTLFNLLNAAHVVKQTEAKKPLQFEGFFGAKLNLIHRKIKSGGKDVYITDIMPSKEFNQMVMDPIKRGLEAKAKTSHLIGGGGSMSLLERASINILKKDSDIEDAEEISVPMDISDQKEITVNFPTETDPESMAPKETDGVIGDNNKDVTGESIAEALLNENGKSPDK